MTSPTSNLQQPKPKRHNNNWHRRRRFNILNLHRDGNELESSEGQTDFTNGYGGDYDCIYNAKGNNPANNDIVNNNLNADLQNLNQFLPEINGNSRRQTISSQGSRSQSLRIRRTRSSGTTFSRHSQPVDSANSSDNYDKAYVSGVPLLGDDFFLHLARRELKCKLRKRNGVLQSGLCVSGQTISDAIRRLHQMKNYKHRTEVVLNIGSVDIMLGKPLVQIEHQFRELINLMQRKGMIPILSTLAPLANFAHVSEIKSKLERFNSYIKWIGAKLQVIDIWPFMVRGEGKTFFECYQREPRYVTGTSVSHVFWNRSGRQRVLHLIQNSLTC